LKFCVRADEDIPVTLRNVYASVKNRGGGVTPPPKLRTYQEGVQGIFRYEPLIPYTGKAVPLQAWSGPQRSRKLRFPNFMTTAQDGGKVVSLTHRPPLPPRNTRGTHFC